MKRLFIPYLCILLFAQCKKQNTDVNGLPAATQSGANTIGFLLNGKPWIPQGYNFYMDKLADDVDFGYRNGVFNITAYQFSANTTKYAANNFQLGVYDSLNNITTFPAKLNLGSNNSSVYRILYTDSLNNDCSLTSNDTTITRVDDISCSGLLTITKLDKNAGIISGTFNATFIRPGCDTMNFTNGRFDMKF
jgi:hypothetical protein